MKHLLARRRRLAAPALIALGLVAGCSDTETAADAQVAEDRAAAEYQREAVAADHAQVRAEHEKMSAEHENLAKSAGAGAMPSGGAMKDDSMPMGAGGMGHDSMSMGGSSMSNAKADPQPKPDAPMPMKDDM